VPQEEDEDDDEDDEQAEGAVASELASDPEAAKPVTGIAQKTGQGKMIDLILSTVF
jgi:hypothetical protein